jgi:hypothetical protein
VRGLALDGREGGEQQLELGRVASRQEVNGKTLDEVGQQVRNREVLSEGPELQGLGSRQCIGGKLVGEHVMHHVLADAELALWDGHHGVVAARCSACCLLLACGTLLPSCGGAAAGHVVRLHSALKKSQLLLRMTLWPCSSKDSCKGTRGPAVSDTI